MRTRLHVISDHSSCHFSFGRDVLKPLVVIVERQASAPGLLQKVNLQPVAVRLQEYRLARTRRRDADPTKLHLVEKGF